MAVTPETVDRLHQNLALADLQHTEIPSEDTYQSTIVTGLSTPLFAEYLRLANQEFWGYYADHSSVANPNISPESPANLQDDFDTNGRRIAIVKTDQKGEVVAGISVVFAQDDQPLDVESYFAIPGEQQKPLRFSIGRLTLNHDSLPEGPDKHRLISRLYQELHVEACALIETLAQAAGQTEYGIFAVVNDKTGSFVHDSYISSTILNTQLLDNPTTKNLVDNFPRYWKRNPRLISLGKGHRVLEDIKTAPSFDSMVASATHPTTGVVKLNTYVDPSSQTSHNVDSSLIRDAATELELKAHDTVPDFKAEMIKKLSPAILQRLRILVGDKEMSLQEWISSLETAKAEDFAYMHEDGEIYKMPPKEVDFLMSIAASILSGGNPDKFIELAELRLRLLRSNKTLAIAGMSVGGEIAVQTVQEQMVYGKVKIAEVSSWHRTNKERAHFPMSELGKNKARYRAKQILERQPWAAVEMYPMGVTAENVDQFVKDAFVVGDFMDDLFMKIMLRKAARNAKRPVIMVSDVGKNPVIEVRRFDVDPTISLFELVDDETLNADIDRFNEINTKLQNFTQQELSGAQQQEKQELTAQRAAIFSKVATAVIGAENISPEFLEELKAYAAQEIYLIPQPHQVVSLAAREMASNIEKLLIESDQPENGVLLPSQLYVVGTTNAPDYPSLQAKQ